ncbi:hypothetical protein [Caballeronia insecticola]|uniref:Uncharacterized protein n=1 Tax=Caballeronia insecticola TaxID=758793 RepID=R4WLU4_9BURK|nr:hypothetical protein [Caballeronia insecticola]BAN25578.1 hypothetical protein BRPE64_BCDS09170 [Caballeronia insecticola]
MNAIYLYLELVALTILIWQCRDKFKPLVAKPLVVKARARSAAQAIFISRS